MKLTLLFGVVLAAVASAQVATEANQGYKDETLRKRVARGLAEEGRDARQKPVELVAQLNIKPGMAVADIGTGVGYMLAHLSRATGPSGTVWAEDIFPDFLRQAKERAASLPNVKFVEGTTRSVELPANSVDRALILDAYHHFDYPKEMMASVAKALKPGGQVAIIEYHKNEKSMGNGWALKHIRLTQDEFVKEIEGFGFRAVKVSDFIAEVQWIGIFEKR